MYELAERSKLARLSFAAFSGFPLNVLIYRQAEMCHVQAVCDLKRLETDLLLTLSAYWLLQQTTASLVCVSFSLSLSQKVHKFCNSINSKMLKALEWKKIVPNNLHYFNKFISHLIGNTSEKKNYRKNVKGGNSQEKIEIFTCIFTS